MKQKMNNKSKDDIVVTSGVRTAIGNLGGSLSSTHQHDLGASVIKEALKRSNLSSSEVSEVVVGNVGQVAESGFIARVCSLRAGLPKEVTSYSVNRQCGSGLQALAEAMMLLKTGQAKVVIACGTENMSMLPFYLRRARYGYGMGNGVLEDGLISILTWPEAPYHNGITAENLASRFNVSREDMDDFASSSQKKALNAIKEGFFKPEIMSLEVPSGRKKEMKVFNVDESPRDTPREKLAQIRPAFKGGGKVTAANSSGISDGAAALVVMRREEADRLHLAPKIRLLDWATAGLDADIMGIGPVPATKKLMDKTGMSLNEVELIEINEAFAVQALCVIRELGLDEQRVNVNGGAIALGHPVGATGAILAVKLMHELRRRDLNTGLVSLCIGGGQGISMLFQNEQ